MNISKLNVDEMFISTENSDSLKLETTYFILL